MIKLDPAAVIRWIVLGALVEYLRFKGLEWSSVILVAVVVFGIDVSAFISGIQKARKDEAARQAHG